MTSDLAFTVTRIGFLILLWILVLSAVATLRHDIFGTVITPRGRGRRQADQKRKKSRARQRVGHHDQPAHQPTSTGPLSLLVTGGPLVGTTLPLGSAAITIGRSPSATLVLEDAYASATHARLSLSNQGWVIEDLGSRNGTFVDDERLVQPLVLRPGTTLRIGQTTLELVQQ